MQTAAEKLAVAVDEWLLDRPIKTPAEARIALALNDYGNGHEIKGKEHCNCDDPDGCDECCTSSEKIAFLQHLAASTEKGK